VVDLSQDWLPAGRHMSSSPASATLSLHIRTSGVSGLDGLCE
jgi:hypothetical protein